MKRLHSGWEWCGGCGWEWCGGCGLLVCELAGVRLLLREEEEEGGGEGRQDWGTIPVIIPSGNILYSTLRP